MRNLPSPSESPQPLDPGSEPRLEILCEAQEPSAAALLALAFRDNPINRAVIGPSCTRRLKVNAHGMTASLVGSRPFSFRRVALRGRETDRGYRDSEPLGALIALDPGGYPVAPPPLAVQLRCLWGQGFRSAWRWSRLYHILDAYHPKEPHCYLALLATDPAHERRGIGRALLNVWLRDVDSRAMPSYLETDRSELVGFYQVAGFRVEHELEPFGTPVWCMSRPAM